MPLNRYRQIQDTTIVIGFFTEKATLDLCFQLKLKLNRIKKTENVNKPLSRCSVRYFPNYEPGSGTCQYKSQHKLILKLPSVFGLIVTKSSEVWRDYSSWLMSQEKTAAQSPELVPPHCCQPHFYHPRNRAEASFLPVYPKGGMTFPQTKKCQKSPALVCLSELSHTGLIIVLPAWVGVYAATRCSPPLAEFQFLLWLGGE